MDANESEATLNEAMEVIKEYATKSKLLEELCPSAKSALYSCQRAFHKHGGPAPNPEKKGVLRSLMEVL